LSLSDRPTQLGTAGLPGPPVRKRSRHLRNFLMAAPFVYLALAFFNALIMARIGDQSPDLYPTVKGVPGVYTAHSFGMVETFYLNRNGSFRERVLRTGKVVSDSRGHWSMDSSNSNNFWIYFDILWVPTEEKGRQGPKEEAGSPDLHAALRNRWMLRERDWVAAVRWGQPDDLELDVDNGFIATKEQAR
jgi:hypothetical protein